MEFSLLESAVSAVCFILYIWLYFFRHKAKKTTAPLAFSYIKHYANSTKSWRVRLFFIPAMLRVLVILLLFIGFSRPRMGTEVVKTARKGIAIQMVIDRSSSMLEPINYKGEELTRLAMVKKVFKKFVLGDQYKLKGRKNDMIGLSSFAGFVDENAPLSLDHQSVVNLAETIQPALRTEDGTMIGDAIYYAALRLVAMEELLQKTPSKPADAPYSVESKIMILLTDGQQTRGGFDPIEASQFAKKNNIKIYTIAITPEASESQSNSFFGGFFSNLNRGVDTHFLEKSAEITGGRFEKGTSGEALEKIYEKINQLEKSQFEERFITYKEQFPIWVWIALLLFILELTLRALVFQKIP